MNKKLLIAVLAIVVLLGAEWKTTVFSAPNLEPMLEAFGRYPMLLFLAIAILPGLGVPNCPLMILGGGAVVVSGGGVEIALLATVGGVIVNILWTYWVAAYPLRAFLWKRVGSSASSAGWFTSLDRSNVLLITLLLHVTPGVPLFIQNYFPGVHRLAYWKYLAIAIPVQSLYTTLIVLTSGKAFEAFGGSLLVVVTCQVALWVVGKVFKLSAGNVDTTPGEV